jgi:hypothetical protein
MPKHRLSTVEGASPECPPARQSPATSHKSSAGKLERVRPVATGSVERFLQAGLIAGIIGYMVAAVIFAVTTVLDGHSSFDTASLLRGTLFLNSEPGADTMSFGPVVYNGPRLVTFLVAGVFIAWLASVAERAPQVWLVAFMLLLFVAAPALGLPTVFEKEVQAELSPWVITAATTLAAAAMGVYLWRSYPSLRAAWPSGAELRVKK